ncbi:hypothetical protein SAMN05443249_5036 [Beijerinckia sp. 28-YEA-48]|nr:hypothetical protein SAMN05443249_5036 [Beijerinckia sp. 28-YEA-48]
MVLALALVLTLNTAQPLNVSFDHDAGIASLHHQAVHTASDVDQDKDGTSGAVHIHAHCGCHATFAFQSAQAQPEAPTIAGQRITLAVSPLASRDPPPLPEPPRA